MSLALELQPRHRGRMLYISKFRFFRVFCSKILRNKHKIMNQAPTLMWSRSLHSIIKSIHFLPISCTTNQVRNFAKSQGKGLKGGKQKSFQLTDEELSDVIDVEAYKSQLEMVKEKLKKDFIEHLSLRSSASNIDNLLVKLEEVEYPLHELAQISKKNPNLIAINMVDFPEALKPTIQAIIDSGSGMNPQQEGTMIYLNVPKLTREHREKLAKNAKTIFVKAKTEIKEVQNHFVREAKKQTDLSEDLVFNASNKIMSMAEQNAGELEKILKSKQKELLGDS